MPNHDWVIVPLAALPRGTPPFKGADSRRGYPTKGEAERRIATIAAVLEAEHQKTPPLAVRERFRVSLHPN